MIRLRVPRALSTGRMITAVVSKDVLIDDNSNSDEVFFMPAIATEVQRMEAGTVSLMQLASSPKDLLQVARMIFRGFR